MGILRCESQGKGSQSASVCLGEGWGFFNQDQRGSGCPEFRVWDRGMKDSRNCLPSESRHEYVKHPIYSTPTNRAGFDPSANPGFATLDASLSCSLFHPSCSPWHHRGNSTSHRPPLMDRRATIVLEQRSNACEGRWVSPKGRVRGATAAVANRSACRHRALATSRGGNPAPPGPRIWRRSSTVLSHCCNPRTSLHIHYQLPFPPLSHPVPLLERPACPGTETGIGPKQPAAATMKTW